MQCLIIAAGQGKRLRQMGESKPLIPIHGVALIERVIETARQGGADDFYVVVGHQGDQVSRFLESLAARLGVKITAIGNENWEKDNGVSVLKAKGHLQGRFLLCMTDHIFDVGMAQKLVACELQEGEIALAVDGDVDNPFVTLDDVTMVGVENGLVRRIGKGLDEYNGFDTGVFLCTPAIFDALAACVESHGNAGLSDGVRALAAEGRVRSVDVSGSFWVDVDDPIAYWRAQNALEARLHQSAGGIPA